MSTKNDVAAFSDYLRPKSCTCFTNSWWPSWKTIWKQSPTATGY